MGNKKSLEVKKSSEPKDFARILLLGGRGVGKSVLYNQFEQGLFADNYDPTVSF